MFEGPQLISDAGPAAKHNSPLSSSRDAYIYASHDGEIFKLR